MWNWVNTCCIRALLSFACPCIFLSFIYGYVSWNFLWMWFWMNISKQEIHMQLHVICCKKKPKTNRKCCQSFYCLLQTHKSLLKHEWMPWREKLLLLTIGYKRNQGVQSESFVLDIYNRYILLSHVFTVVIQYM